VGDCAWERKTVSNSKLNYFVAEAQSDLSRKNKAMLFPFESIQFSARRGCATDWKMRENKIELPR
jgi:hypothetical protein